MKTTIILDDEIYRELAKYAIDELGSSKKMSKIINNLLKKYFGVKKRKFSTIKLGKKVSVEEMEKIVEEMFYGSSY